AKNWPWHVAAELERSHLCQVFSRVLLQKRHGQPATLSVSGVRYFRDRGKLVGQNAVFPTLRWPGFYLDGQTGFGWAARAGLLEQVPLYDAGVVGGGDKMIYVASFCDSEDRWHAAAKLVRSRNAPCPRCNHVSQATLYTQDYLAWAERWAKAVGGKVGYADLAIRDLFHGEREHKRYRDRKQILLNYDYDPATDLEQNADGCWKWSSDKGGLHADVKQYFRERRES
ncbi:MAG: hypothetical protein O7G30_08015, partial [Proteobacteria bacterium]|nr:hypothetical protein [Pseudomonadota bacterium]